MSVRVVIVGGSFSAHIAFTALYKINPELEVTIVSPNTHSYFNIAAPRLLIEPEKFDKVIFSIKDFVSRRSKGKGNYVNGSVVGVDFDSNTITVDSDDKSEIHYDILVLATGTASKFKGFKVNESHKVAKKSIEETAESIKSSKTIAIIGAGPIGVETAGEIAHKYSSINVSLFTGKIGPLAAFPVFTNGATAKLEALGVDIINHIRSRSFDGNTVHFDNGDSKTFDLVIDATSQTANSDYLPDSVKDDRGLVLTNKQLLVKGTSNVLAIGDIVSGSARSVVDFKLGQLGTFKATIRNILDMSSVTNEWRPVNDTVLVPISLKGGEGSLYGWHCPSWLVRLLKGKTYYIKRAGQEFT